MNEFDLLLNKTEVIIKEAHMDYDSMYAYDQGPDTLADRFDTNVKYGLSKIVFPCLSDNYVVKLPIKGNEVPEWNDETNDYNIDENGDVISSYDDYGYNYCELETEIYQKAIDDGVAEAFAGEWEIGVVNNIPVYAQEKVTSIGDSNSGATQADTEKILNQESYCYTPIESVAFMADLLKYYGEEKFLKLLDFLKKEQLSDFHNGNIGYIGERPVFVDYSGFSG